MPVPLHGGPCGITWDNPCRILTTELGAQQGAQCITVSATRARRWVMGAEADGHSESKDSALLKWGLTWVGVAESEVGLVLL